MGKNSAIEWTDHTFNPWWGCTKVSEGCEHCYAQTLAHRLGNDVWGNDAPRRFFGEKHWEEPKKWNTQAQGQTLVFCGSMCDVFEDRNDLIGPRQKLWNLIDKTRNLTWLLLTKRPQNIPAMASAIPSNAWLGVTVENKKNMWRVVELMKMGAPVSFLSLEPMLEPINLGFPLRREPKPKLWVIVGGESGPGYRPFDGNWARDIRNQCIAASVPFFMKQMGGHPYKYDKLEDIPQDLRIREFPEL